MQESVAKLPVDDVSILLAMSLQEVLKIQKSENSTNCSIRPAGSRRISRSKNRNSLSDKGILAVLKVKRTFREMEDNEEHSGPKRTCVRIPSSFGKENVTTVKKSISGRSTKIIEKLNKQKLKSSSPLWLKVVRQQHGMSCHDKLKKLPILV
uniref:Uncharacterized protein n=1 Tax=Ciona savignyi TaxID=51511 RepID=H2ZK82_CIOSA